MKPLQTINWEEGGTISFIDQTQLPNSFRIVRCRSVERLIMAIRRLEIRGAPALGIAGALGVALASRTIRERDDSKYLDMLRTEAERIAQSRPTAVNLSWGVRQALDAAMQGTSISDIRIRALEAALRVAEDDARSCHALGEYGAILLPDPCTVLTHCNAGALACREWGTALGVVRSAVEQGKEVRVLACETRPLLQGARLTAWELFRDGIPVTVIPDSSAALLMMQKEIDVVIVGADRVTRDAVFNKVGTYMHALCARHHCIPFYVAAPLSTFDPMHRAAEITIEERGREEVASFCRVPTVPDGVPVRNPAFDATPHELVTAFFTDAGAFRPPLEWDLLSTGGPGT
jgi:methylthioribose-1-phosphate isomerase